MTTDNPPVVAVHVTCKMCMKEIPISEAIVPEATDYAFLRREML